MLQARKTEEDVASVCEMCSALTPLQICKILNLYTPVDEFEQRVPVSFIRKVQAKLEERSGSSSPQEVVSIEMCVKLQNDFKTLFLDSPHGYTIQISSTFSIQSLANLLGGYRNTRVYQITDAGEIVKIRKYVLILRRQ